MWSLLALALAGLSACDAEDTLAQESPTQSIEQRKIVPLRRLPEIDLLLVIDNSPSMAEEQVSLARNSERFGYVLESLESYSGCPASLHVGVVSADLGTGALPRPRRPRARARGQTATRCATIWCSAGPSLCL